MKPKILFIEMSIIIVCFCMICSVSIAMIGKVKKLEKDADNLREATYIAQCFAERSKQMKSLAEYTGTLNKLGIIKDINEEESNFYFYYDKDWREMSEEDAKYIVEVNLSAQNYNAGEMLKQVITIYTGAIEVEKILLTMETNKYNTLILTGGEK